MKGVAGKAIRKTMKTKGRQKGRKHRARRKDRNAGDTPTRGILPKSLDLHDCKGVDVFRDDKEIARV
jgi:hypothetical protein